MSHKATAWAWQVGNLTPAQKLVLMCLADHHTDALGCFPGQDTIAKVCNISRSSLNNQLDALERLGLFRRLLSVNEITKKRERTRYILAFEDAEEGGAKPAYNPPSPTYSHVQNLDMEKSEAKSVSEADRVVESHVQILDMENASITGGPCPKAMSKNHVQNLDMNLKNNKYNNIQAREDGPEGVPVDSDPVPEPRAATQAVTVQRGKRTQTVTMPKWSGDPSIIDRVLSHPHFRNRQEAEGFIRAYVDTSVPEGQGLRARTRTAFERMQASGVFKADRFRPAVELRPPP